MAENVESRGSKCSRSDRRLHLVPQQIILFRHTVHSSSAALWFCFSDEFFIWANCSFSADVVYLKHIGSNSFSFCSLLVFVLFCPLFGITHFWLHKVCHWGLRAHERLAVAKHAQSRCILCVREKFPFPGRVFFSLRFFPVWLGRSDRRSSWCFE